MYAERTYFYVFATACARMQHLTILQIFRTLDLLSIIFATIVLKFHIEIPISNALYHPLRTSLCLTVLKSR